MSFHFKKNIHSVFILIVLINITSFQSCNSQNDNRNQTKNNSAVLHSFQGTDGDSPKGTLTLAGKFLYGYTAFGGKYNKGVILKTDTSGNNFSVLYNFEEGENNGLGNEPHHDAMLNYENEFYGVACYGGNNNNGVIFKISADGSAYTPIHIFKGGSDDGANPRSGVIVVDSIFYGAAPGGGEEGKGVIYKINPSGTGFKVLYSFSKATGHNPHCRLTLGSDGHTVYGMTKTGGSHGVGVVFGFDLIKSEYRVLHEFQKNSGNGYTPEHGYLTRHDITLYGMTHYGGESDKGIIFSISENNSDFKILHSFGLDSKDGKFPYGSLQMSNSYLYGTTQEGGKNDKGSIFKIDLNGNNYQTIFSFDKPVNGEYPIDNVTISADGNTLYSFGQQGGYYDQKGHKKFGTIFRLDLSDSKNN